MMYMFAFIFGVICGAFCMGIASASKDDSFTEEDEKELMNYIDKKYKSSTKDDASS